MPPWKIHAVAELVALKGIVHKETRPIAVDDGCSDPAGSVARSVAAEVSGVYDVKAFGATGDGKTLDTPAINKAIEAAAADALSDGNGGYDAAEPNPWDKYQDFGHSHWHNSPIWGERIEILGPGLIWDKGLTRGPGASRPGVGNESISLKNSRNVTIRDISIPHGGHFAILATGVDNLTIDDVKIDTNRDGMDIDSCRNVRVSSCS